MTNDHVTEELDRFRQAPGRAFYALQIDAPWGAGKTHFVQSYLDRACSPVEPPGRTGAESRYVLISLFGTASVEDIEKQLVAQLFSESERLLGSLASSVVGGASAYMRVGDGPLAMLRQQGPHLLSQRLARVRDLGGLVVFDDIERTRMPLRDALGYVNRFVEHEGFKVILVTNEKAFRQENASAEDQRNLDDLRRFKEKLVGRTLSLVPDPESAFDAFVNGMADANARRLAAQHRQSAIHLFRASGRDNLRSMRMGLEAFDRLVPLFEPVWLERADAVREVLLGCLFVAIEHAAGASADAVIHPTRSRFTGLFGRDREEQPTPEKLEARRIIDAYEGQLNLDGPPIPFSTIRSLVAEGRLVAGEVHKGMSESPLVVGQRAAPPWRILIEIWDLDIEGSRQAVARARQQFDDLAVTDAGELLHRAGIMLWRADCGDLSLSNGEPVLPFLESYLNRLRDAGLAIRPSSDSLGRSRFSAHGYVVTGAEEGRADLKQAAALIEGAALDGLRRNFPELRERLLAELARQPRDLSEIGTSGEMRRALDMPMFQDWEVRPFADLLLRDGRFDYEALKWLTDGRYDNGHQLTGLAGEADWLVRLRDELDARIARVEPPFQQLWGRAIAHLVDPALARLQRQETLADGASAHDETADD